MTRPSVKRRERFFAEEAGKFLNKKWSLGPDHECPDFIVREGRRIFGLEVSEVFMGSQGQAGSLIKCREAENQKTIDALNLEYQRHSNVPLSVKFVGDTCAANLATVVPALLAKDFASKPVGCQVVIDLANGLRLYVTRGFRPDWFSVSDRVGWVERHPIRQIAGAIDKKSPQLPRYRDVAGSDVRLLLIADRHFKSGKLMLEERLPLDRKGFQVVYFLSYPESITVFD